MSRYYLATWRLETASITPTDIYDVFALSLLGRADLGEDAPLARFEGDQLREKFLAVFMPLLRGQIEKYLRRPDRHDPEQVEWLETAHTAGPDELAKMFDTATFRSERHRAEAPEDVYNTRWAEVARAVGRLQRASGLDAARELGGYNLRAKTGGLLTLVHNTMTPVLDKLPGWRGLKEALDTCHAGTPAEIYAGANPDVKRLLRKNLPRAEIGMSRWHAVSAAMDGSGEEKLRLECRCADDRGAGYKDESERTDDDIVCIEDYEETRDAQLAMAKEAEARGIEHYVADSDDRDSRHSDAYVYFPPSRLAEVAEMLDFVGLDGDILDVPKGFPAAEAERIGREHGWSVEETV